MASHLILKHPEEWSSSWREYAACRGVAYEEGTFQKFFPDRGEKATAGRSMCNGCPVRIRCLDFALVNNIQQGMWGGKTDSQRRLIRRKWSRQRSIFLQEIALGLDAASIILADG